MSTDPVRVASVGLGWWGGILANAAPDAGLRLVSCYSPSDRRSDFAAKYDCRAAASWEELLGDPDVEAIMLATPHSTHADQVVEASAAGKHVFAEKPLALNVPDAKRAVAAADAAGIVLEVGHNRRRQPGLRRLKELVDTDALGMIHHVEANLSHPKGLKPRTNWRADPAESPAGGMTGLGVHMVDNLIYLVGRPTRLAAFSKQLAALGTLDEATTVMLEFESGPLGFVGTTTVIPDVASTAAFGTKAAAWNSSDGERFYRQEVGDKERREELVDTLDTVRDELAEFATCVRTGATPEVGGAEALEVVAVLEGIIESARTGQVVDLDEVRARI
jgi:predicted dehydrogenase